MSLIPTDLHHISQLNSDTKHFSGLEARKFMKTMNHTISPLQLVAGDDRRIHHGIAKAHNVIQAVTKNKQVWALLDKDFKSTIDFVLYCNVPQDLK